MAGEFGKDSADSWLLELAALETVEGFV